LTGERDEPRTDAATFIRWQVKRFGAQHGNVPIEPGEIHGTSGTHQTSSHFDQISEFFREGADRLG
jgi:hypothetical protein